MPKYEGMQSILNEITGKYAELGFRLYEVDDHILALDYMDMPIAQFSSRRATIPKIREACDRYLKTGRTW